MRAHFGALLGGATLPAAAGVALVASWFYAIEWREPVPGLAFLVVAVVALVWWELMRRRQRPGSGCDNAGT